MLLAHARVLVFRAFELTLDHHFLRILIRDFTLDLCAELCTEGLWQKKIFIKLKC